MSEYLKIVPSNIIEPIITKAVLGHQKYLDILNNRFEKGWFQTEEYGIMIDYILKAYRKLNKIPTIETLDLILAKVYNTRPEKYNEMSVKLQALNSVDLSKYDTELLDEDILNYIKDRGLYFAVASHLDSIDRNHSVAEVMDQLRDFSTLDYDTDLGLNYLKDIEKHCDDLTKLEQKITTGWSTVDYVTNGGWLRDGRCLALFSGQTHVGKSLVLSNMAANAIQDNKFVVIISLEMSEKVYASRIDAHVSNININKLNDNITSLRDQVINIREKYPESMLVIKEFPPDSISCNHIQTYIEKLTNYHKRKPDVILIDYLNLLQPNEKTSEGSYFKYRTVATEMRRLTYLINTPVISCIQNNRGGFDSSAPNLNQTADSIGIPFVADFIGALFQDEGDRENGIIKLSILKNRLGGFIGKTLVFNINYETLRIIDNKALTTTNENIQDIQDELDELESM